LLDNQFLYINKIYSYALNHNTIGPPLKRERKRLIYRLIVLLAVFCFIVGIGAAFADEMPAGPVKPLAALARDTAGMVNDVGKIPDLVQAVAEKKKGPLHSRMAFIGGAGAQVVARFGGALENVLSPYNDADYGVPVKGKANIARKTVQFFVGK